MQGGQCTHRWCAEKERHCPSTSAHEASEVTTCSTPLLYSFSSISLQVHDFPFSLYKEPTIFYTKIPGWQVPLPRSWTKREHANNTWVSPSAASHFHWHKPCRHKRWHVHTKPSDHKPCRLQLLQRWAQDSQFKTLQWFPLQETRSSLCMCTFLTIQNQKHGWKLFEKQSFPSKRKMSAVTEVKHHVRQCMAWFYQANKTSGSSSQTQLKPLIPKEEEVCLILPRGNKTHVIHSLASWQKN